MSTSFFCKSAVIIVTGLFGSQLYANEPSYNSAVVDGNFQEWDLTNDRFTNMYEAGNPTKDHMSTAYLRYDCNSKTLFTLVLAEDGFTPSATAENAWVKEYSVQNSSLVSGNSGNDGNAPDFSWVSDNGTLLGFESSLQIDPGIYNSLEVHINIEPGRTSSTGKKAQGYTGLVLQCGTDPDEPDGNSDARPELDIEKFTQGFDADTEKGAAIEVNDTVYWRYSVTNTGNVPLTDIYLSDSMGEEVVCDTQGTARIGYLAVGDTFNCSATNKAILGQYKNRGDATTVFCADESNCTDVSDSDPSHYYGVLPGIDIEKHIVGEDADNPPGVFLIENTPLNCEYFVTNTGTISLSNIVVMDNAGTSDDASDDFSPTYLSGDTNSDNKLDIDEVWTYGSSDGTCATATPGQHASDSSVAGQYTVFAGPEGTEETRTVEDIDPVNYYGFVSNRPSLEVYGLHFDIEVDADKTYYNGSFVIENASDGDEVQAIGINSFHTIIEYRSDKKWDTVEELNKNCTFNPEAPAIFEGAQGAAHTIEFTCTVLGTPQSNTVRLTQMVDLFNRDKDFFYKASQSTGQDLNKTTDAPSGDENVSNTGNGKRKVRLKKK